MRIFHPADLGCSAACRDALLREHRLEAYAIDPLRGVAYVSDELNPMPPRRD